MNIYLPSTCFVKLKKTINISGGDYGLSAGSNTSIDVLGGQVTTTGATNAYRQNRYSTLNIMGGSVTCNGMVEEVNGDNKIEINGSGSKLTVNGDILASESSSKVILKSGELQLNQGNLSGKGTLEKRVVS